MKNSWRAQLCGLSSGLLLMVGVLASTTSVAASASNLGIFEFSPAQGQVGTAVSINGTGFIPGDTVYFAGILAKGVKVNKAGTLIRTSVPLASTGPITVVDPSGASAQSASAFDVTQGLFVTPRYPYPGQRITIEGTAFHPDSGVTITLDEMSIDQSPTDSNGNFSVVYHLPNATKPGTNTLGVLRFPDQLVLYVSSPWPQFGNNSDHTSADPFELFLTESHVAAGLKDNLLLPIGNVGSPVAVATGVAYVVVNTGSSATLQAVNLTTKKVMWSSTSFGPSTSGPAVAANRVFVASYDGHVYAFATTCSSSPCGPVWTSVAADGGAQFVASSPTVYNGEVFVAATNGELYAYQASCSASCSPTWKTAASGEAIYGSPAVDGVNGGTVFVGSNTHVMYAYPVSCSTPCKPEWTSTTGGDIQGSATVENGMVFAESGDGKLYAYSAKCASACLPTWVSTPLAAGSSVTPAAVGGRVYVAGGNTLYGFPETCSDPCSPVWQTKAEADGAFGGPIAIANGVLFALAPATTGLSGVLDAFDTTNGSCTPNCTPIWQVGSGFSLKFGPIVSGLVFFSNGNNLYGFG